MSYYSDEGATAEDGQGNNITSYITKIVQKYNADTSSWDTIAEINDPHANPWDVPYISRQEGDKYKIIYNVKDINNIAAESKTRLINITAPQPEYIPGTVAAGYTNGSTANSPAPLHNYVVAFNWGGMFSDLSGNANPWWHTGDGNAGLGGKGGPPFDTWHEFLLRHTSSYFTKELWDFMRLPTLEIEVKASGPWSDSFSWNQDGVSGSSTEHRYENRYRLKNTATGEYWDWGSQKSFDFGMANGQWSSFVPFGSNASLEPYTIDETHQFYQNLREGLQTIANGGGAFTTGDGDPQQSQWTQMLFTSLSGLGIGGVIAYGGTYNSETNTFNVSTPSMDFYLSQEPYYGGTLPVTYADMWSSAKAIASAAVLEGIPAKNTSRYASHAGFPYERTAFYPNMTQWTDMVEGGRAGHAWMRSYIAYLSAGIFYALNEPANPDLSEFFSEDSVQYRYPIVGNTDVPPQPGVKSIKSPDPNLIVEHASSDHHGTHGVPINNDFHTFTQGSVSAWLVPIVGDYWYKAGGSFTTEKKDAPDTYICGHVPPYFT